MTDVLHAALSCPVCYLASLRGDRPLASGSGRGFGRVDLRGLEYGDRRRRLFSALRGLGPEEHVHLTSDRADDVLWLRYEVEARIAERYSWSLPDESRGTASITVRRLRPSDGFGVDPPG